MLLRSLIPSLWVASSISNFVAGIRAWHVVHRLPWTINSNETSSLIKASRILAPATSKCPQRLPFTPPYIDSLLRYLDLKNPLDAAVFACLTTCFYSCARLGEFTVPTLGGFSPSLHITILNVHEDLDRNGRSVKRFALPFTKTSPTGEEVFWATQLGNSDPRAAFENHLKINVPPPTGPLFAYKFKRGWRPLTKREFLKHLSSAARESNLIPLQGHSIRIGGTLEYLLRGVPFDVVKTMGRWSSDAFTGYLRKHAQVLAPYLQDSPEVHDEFVRLAMPRPRS